MDSKCPGCGSLYNGNSQFCSRHCYNHDTADVDLVELTTIASSNDNESCEEKLPSMDSICLGCGSLYNGNSQFCSRYCYNHDFDKVEVDITCPSTELEETPSKKRKCEETSKKTTDTRCVRSFFDCSKKKTRCSECGSFYNEDYEICSRECSNKQILKKYLECKQSKLESFSKKQRQV